MKIIDFLSDWQKDFAFGLGEVIIQEKSIDSEILTKLIMSTNQFDNIVDFYHVTYVNLNQDSLLYNYFSRQYIGGDENWAVNNEVKVENVEEFLNHILNIDTNYETKQMVNKEYDAIIGLCKSAIDNKTQLYFKADDY